MFSSDAQIQSLVTEVQNIIGQVREQGMQVKETTEKIRNIERNDTNERFGIELAGALSRIETVSLHRQRKTFSFIFDFSFFSWRKISPKLVRRKVLEVLVRSLMSSQKGWISLR